jgi:nucleoside-diphosphate-sugar epimerase
MGDAMKYFVTGATGFVGGRVARQLVAAGHQVGALVRNPAKAGDLARLGITLHTGDVTDKASMAEAMAGVDGVFHIAGWYKIGVRDKSQGQKVNVDGTRHVLELMQELRIPRGVYTSTLAVNSDTHGKLVDESYRFTGQHFTVYDRTKADAHTIAEDFIGRGLPLVIVQPGLIYGPGDTSSVRTMLIQYLKRQLPLLPKVTAYSWAHVDDIAAGHILALERGQAGQNYFVCGPSHTLVETVEMAQAITGIPAPRLRVGPGVLRAMAACMGLVEKVVPVPETYSYEGLRVLAGATYLGDNAKARRELEWNPRPLEVGLRETLEHEMQLLGMRPGRSAAT